MPCNSGLTYTNRPQRICILTKRVFDACIQQRRLDEQLFVNFPEPAETFVEVISDGTSIISDLTITPTNTAGCSRVRFTQTIPLQVVAQNANGDPVVCTTQVVLNQDLLMRVPRDSLVPAEVSVTTNVRGILGSLEDNILTITLCTSIIVRIVADVDIVINTCGFINLPPCNNYSEDVCSAAFAMPIYPTR